MARDVALVTSWTQSARGREGKALEAFTDFLTFWGKLAADGKCEEAEPYFAEDGSNGFAIVRGKSDVIREAIESEDFEVILQKAQLTVEGLRSQIYLTGDAEVQKLIGRYGEIAGQLGYL